MIIGVPKEIKIRENRVAVVPGGVKMLTSQGHRVLIEKGAGIGAGISDGVYQESGATIVHDVEELWGSAEMIMKVKEPIEAEYTRMQPGQILYTYLHLAAEPALAKVLLQRRVRAIAYETIQLADGTLPLLRPMSEVAGRMAVQVGAQCLQKHNGGKGILLGGVPGVRRGRVGILGGGVAGTNAAKMAIGLGAEVTIVDVNQSRLTYLDDIFGCQVTTLMSTPEIIERTVLASDLLIGTVLVTGAKAPRVVAKDLVRRMEPGSVIVDVAIDQGGCVETIRPTTHDDPIYFYEGISHYGVTNMPGDVPCTSAYALTNVTLSYACDIANKGFDRAMRESAPLRLGLNTYEGEMTHEVVAHALGYKRRDTSALLSQHVAA